jgi:hypothetical protein
MLFLSKEKNMCRYMIKSYLFMVVLLIGNLISSNWLWVEDPKMPWRDGQGTIEEAIISVRPQGLYTEYGLYLTFSARNLGFTNSDSLEIQFYFELPEKSIVHDSWLWIGDDIINGIIMDKWTASAIYDTIVNRRKDPSILLKTGSRQYELRIYPMTGDEERKVKITYLVPNNWDLLRVTAPLPTNLLRTSKYELSTFYLLTWLNEQWQNPGLVEFPSINFQQMSDTLFGNYYRADIPVEAIQGTLNFSVNSPLVNGVYLDYYPGIDESVYQLVFLPSQALNIQTPIKVAVLFDYDPSNSDESKSEIINTVKTQLHSTLAPGDSFNLIFSQLNIYRVSQTWLPADSLTIENVFASISSGTLADYSNLPSLLGNAVDFINANGHDGSILLVANSDQLGDYQSANQLINDLLNLMDPILPVQVADFQSRNLDYHWIGGRYYRGNEYFYTNITRLTSGNYFRTAYSNYSFFEVVNLCFQSLSGFISSFDLYTSLQGGFCFGRFYIDPLSFTTYLNRPILQIGKFNGTFPFIINASGVYNDQPFSQEIVIPQDQISLADSLPQEMWVGNYIKSLESNAQTNAVISEIINQSTSERVLSIYTAFLCLDPERGGEVCYDCLDESQLVGINNLNAEIAIDTMLTANPNPFNLTTHIRVRFKKTINREDVTFKIYNVLGQVVRSFKFSPEADNRTYEILWDGTNNLNVPVSSGTYFFVVQKGAERHSLRLLLLK